MKEIIDSMVSHDLGFIPVGKSKEQLLEFIRGKIIALFLDKNEGERFRNSSVKEF